MKTTVLLSAIFLFAGVSQAQIAEQRPVSPAPPAAAQGADHGSREYYTHGYGDFDFDDPVTVPVEINPDGSAPSGGLSVTPGPATTYAHGDSNAPIPGAFLAPRLQSPPRGQAAPPAGNISGQFQQLVQARNAANASLQTQPRLQVGNMSLADLARQVRAEKATEEKATLKIKQDAQGKAILVEKKQ